MRDNEKLHRIDTTIDIKKTKYNSNKVEYERLYDVRSGKTLIDAGLVEGSTINSLLSLSKLWFNLCDHTFGFGCGILKQSFTPPQESSQYRADFYSEYESGSNNTVDVPMQQSHQLQGRLLQ